MKIADRKLKMMEEDYKRTIEADKIDDLKLKGKFEKENFNNINFENKDFGSPDNEKENDNEIENGNYQMISEDEDEKKSENSVNLQNYLQITFFFIKVG